MRVVVLLPLALALDHTVMRYFGSQSIKRHHSRASRSWAEASLVTLEPVNASGRDLHFCAPLPTVGVEGVGIRELLYGTMRRCPLAARLHVHCLGAGAVVIPEMALFVTSRLVIMSPTALQQGHGQGQSKRRQLSARVKRSSLG